MPANNRRRSALTRKGVPLVQETGAGVGETEKLTLPNLRAALGWSRNQLARVMNSSDRAIVNWESGDAISPIYAAKLREIQSVYNELQQLMNPEEIGPGLLTYMDDSKAAARLTSSAKARPASSGPRCFISAPGCRIEAREGFAEQTDSRSNPP